MTRRMFATMLVAMTIAGCGPAAGPVVDDTELVQQARELAHRLLIVDGHVDVPYRMREAEVDISVAAEGGDFDYPRARQGGLDAPFMSIYVPARYQDEGGAKGVADKLIDLVEGFEARWPDKFAVVSSTEELESVVEAGKIALPLGMENGAAVEDDLANLEHFYRRGIRYITLTHSENNQICDSSYAREKRWGGLSEFGRSVVSEMNRLGIMIDVSHVSDDSFYEVLELTSTPVIASHSSCRRFTPGFERNMNDDMLRALAGNGGVIMINFGSAFLTEEANRVSLARWEKYYGYIEEHGLTREDEAAKDYMKSLREENPVPLADVTDVADHIDHAVSIAGIDHVGLGSDFDGVGPTTPTGLEDASKYPNLLLELLRRGYSSAEIEKICSGNVLRVWRAAEGEARKTAAGEDD